MKFYNLGHKTFETDFRFLIHVSVGEPLVIMIAYIHHSFAKWLINSILWHFKINADISTLDKSIILGLPFCVVAGYSVLTYTNDFLTYWLPDVIKTINWIWKAFPLLGMSSTTENAQKIQNILQILLNVKFSILKHLDDA